MVLYPVFLYSTTAVCFDDIDESCYVIVRDEVSDNRIHGLVLPKPRTVNNRNAALEKNPNMLHGCSW